MNARLSLLRLDNKVLPAVSVYMGMAMPGDGYGGDTFVYVVGDAANDRIDVRDAGNGIVIVNGVRYDTLDYTPIISIDGGAGNDCISFTSRKLGVTIKGGDGNDFIRGGDKDDTIDGGAGTDWLFGMNGNDTLIGGDGRDYIFGGHGIDLAIAQKKDRVVHAERIQWV